MKQKTKLGKSKCPICKYVQDTEVLQNQVYAITICVNCDKIYDISDKNRISKY